MQTKVLVTGCSGLIGSEAVIYYERKGFEVHGFDNNMRKEFFGEKGDTLWNLKRLKDSTKAFFHYPIDIRNRVEVFDFFKRQKPSLVIHCAAQPSHDRARDIPLIDFEVNALGTINLLEAMRQYAPTSVFIFMSTNKVYGDSPNELPLKETSTRWEYARQEDFFGISESCRIDSCLHSIFGASKAAADIMVQEYGKYYGLQTVAFRGGCLTGPQHSSVELHGFLSYLVKIAVQNLPYKVFGYKAKQVRDQIHCEDVISAFEAYRQNPRPGEVYNLGGGRKNSASVLECIQKIEDRLSRKFVWEYSEENRKGDHICYISDMRKFASHYPSWCINRSLDSILDEMLSFELRETRKNNL